MGYLYANFNLPMPLCSRLRPDIRDRQTDVRRAASLNASALWGRGIIRNERISLITHRQRMQYLSALERPMSLIYRTAKRNENVLLLPAKQRLCRLLSRSADWRRVRAYTGEKVSHEGEAADTTLASCNRTTGYDGKSRVVPSQTTACPFPSVQQQQPGPFVSHTGPPARANAIIRSTAAKTKRCASIRRPRRSRYCQNPFTKQKPDPGKTSDNYCYAPAL